MTEVFTLTQTSELDVELTVFKNCDPLIPLMGLFLLLCGFCGPQCTKSW